MTFSMLPQELPFLVNILKNGLCYNSVQKAADFVGAFTLTPGKQQTAVSELWHCTDTV